MKRYVLLSCLALLGFGLSSCTTYVEDSHHRHVYNDRPTPRPYISGDRNDRYERHHSDRYDNDRRTVHYRSTRDRYRHRQDRDNDTIRVRANVNAPVRIL